MPKYHLHHVEFYITNVCNLTCTNCRSFNNFKFSGHYKFNQADHQSWADILDLDTIVILGGEPTLHPDLFKWMIGLRKAWPNSIGELVTNGTYLSRIVGLHEIAAKYNYEIKINMHAKDLREMIAEQIFLAFGDCIILPNEDIYNQKVSNTIKLKTNLGVIIHCLNSEEFQISPVKNNKFEFYNSNPEIAHKNCIIANCHHMVDGKLYKCGFMATASEFLKQQHVLVPPLLAAYTPLIPSTVNSAQVLKTFLNFIPQCSFCQEENSIIKINATLKNKKIFKIQSLIRPIKTQGL